MDAIERTNSLERKDIALNLIVGNENNPNKMTSREFDLLCDNINKTGITDPILVRKTEGDKYRIIGGHHRYKAAKYLGFDKALKSIVSAEILPGEANKNGLIVDTSFLGIVSKEPELYVDKDEKYTVRKYVEITCAKVKSKEIAGTGDELSKVAEDLIVLNETFNAPKSDDKSSALNDGPRKPAGEGKTSNGYERPDWATQVPTPQNVSK